MELRNWLLFLALLPLLTPARGFAQSQTAATYSQKNPGSATIGDSKRPDPDWFYKTMAINYVLLNAMDLVTTFEGLNNGAQEANPISKLFIENRPATVLIKGAVTGGVLYGLSRVKKHDKKAAYITLGLLNVVYGVVVANNIGVYLRLK